MLMQALDIIIEDDRWSAHDLEGLAHTAIAATLSHRNLDPDVCEVSVLACDDAQIATLNAEFREKPTPTNVLSWPAQERGVETDGATPDLPDRGPDGMIELGDIAISYDTCVAEATVADRPIPAHVTHLIIHGVLHLLGYDHIRDSDGDLMEAIEVEILGKLGYDNPYVETAARNAAQTRRQG